MADSNSEADCDTEADSDSEADWETEADSDIEAEYDTEAESDTEADSDSDTDLETIEELLIELTLSCSLALPAFLLRSTIGFVVTSDELLLSACSRFFSFLIFLNLDKAIFLLHLSLVDANVETEMLVMLTARWRLT